MSESTSDLSVNQARLYGLTSVVFFAAVSAFACFAHGAVGFASVTGAASALLAVLVAARPSALVTLYAHINPAPTAKELRQFGGLCFLFFGGIAAWGWGASWAPVSAGASAVLGLLGAVAPNALRGFFVGWMAAVSPIGWTISQLLMGSIFFLLITPIGLVMRMMGHDPMLRSFDPAATTYWAEREPRTDPKSYFRQF